MNDRIVDARGTRIHLVEEGEGPLVLLVHGFPESWYSYRHQLHALAEAGFSQAHGTLLHVSEPGVLDRFAEEIIPAVAKF